MYVCMYIYIYIHVYIYIYIYTYLYSGIAVINNGCCCDKRYHADLSWRPSSAVGLGDALDLVLLLDGVAVG